ncbi:MAG: hypothetical protein R2748_16085 [Bryobacterales bacterium]
MPWQRPAGLALIALLAAIWSLYVRRRALEVRARAQAAEKETHGAVQNP